MKPHTVRVSNRQIVVQENRRGLSFKIDEDRLFMEPAEALRVANEMIKLATPLAGRVCPYCFIPVTDGRRKSDANGIRPKNKDDAGCEFCHPTE